MAAFRLCPIHILWIYFVLIYCDWRFQFDAISKKKKKMTKIIWNSSPEKQIFDAIRNTHEANKMFDCTWRQFHGMRLFLWMFGFHTSHSYSMLCVRLNICIDWETPLGHFTSIQLVRTYSQLIPSWKNATQSTILAHSWVKNHILKEADTCHLIEILTWIPTKRSFYTNFMWQNVLGQDKLGSPLPSLTMTFIDRTTLYAFSRCQEY